ncbi:MAG: hypothetical protein WCW26_00380 [Candidatus Buchananbacteria bacterium]
MKKILTKINLKTIVSLFFALLIFGLSCQNTFAVSSIFSQTSGGLQTATNEAYGGGQKVNVDETTFSGGLVIIIYYLLNFLAVVFFLGLIYAGYIWMTARGEQTKIDQAKKITREVTIALIITLTARVFTEFILTQIGRAIQ